MMMLWLLACLTAISVSDGQSLRTIDGRDLPIDDSAYKATVCVFVSTTCPIANAYQPRLKQLETEFRDRQVRFIMVYPGRQFDSAAIAQHCQEYAITAPCVLDADLQWTRRLGARVTPEAIVIAGGGQIVYRGRIDNQYVALGKKRPEPTEHDLKDILQALTSDRLNTQELPHDVPAIGCIIR